VAVFLQLQLITELSRPTLPRIRPKFILPICFSPATTGFQQMWIVAIWKYALICSTIEACTDQYFLIFSVIYLTRNLKPFFKCPVRTSTEYQLGSAMNWRNASDSFNLFGDVSFPRAFSHIVSPLSASDTFTQTLSPYFRFSAFYHFPFIMI
jgi:hypothetical protein